MSQAKMVAVFLSDEDKAQGHLPNLKGLWPANSHLCGDLASGEKFH